MRITLDIDTDHITADDRRVLMAIAGHDAGELRITREGEQAFRDLSQPGAPLVPPGHTPPGPPSPTPAPAGFLQKLGEAVGQFAGTQHEARLPVVQQAGVRTRSTMPEDDDAPADVVDADAAQAAVDENRAQLVRDGAVTVDPEPGPVDWEAHGKASPIEQRAIREAHGLTPRLVQTPPPVRHTSP